MRKGEETAPENFRKRFPLLCKTVLPVLPKGGLTDTKQGSARHKLCGGNGLCLTLIQISLEVLQTTRRSLLHTRQVFDGAYGIFSPKVYHYQVGEGGVLLRLPIG